MIAGRETLRWKSWDRMGTRILTAEGQALPLSDVAVIWWRRIRADQQAATAVPMSDHQRDIVNNDCRGALAGILASEFAGDWISPPGATDRAADKVFQLTVARQCGFRVPRTLVTQSRKDVIAFAQEEKRIVVKPVVGAKGPLLFTQFLDDPTLVPERSFATSPAIYQEYIEGVHHIRLNCFGDKMYAALIRTDDLDWRPNLDVPIYKWPVPESLASRVRQVLACLNLRMGIIDLKLTPEGEEVWLEVNPQGQFLFLEPLTGEPLTEHFADFLLTSSR